MSRAGDVFENVNTGERGYVRIGTEETGGELMVVDLRVRPGGAVMGEHVHWEMEETFTILEGAIGYSLGGEKGIARAGESFSVPKGVFHDWWNGGEEEAHLIVEFRPAARFEEMITTFFGLAQEGKTDAKGVPGLLQLAVLSQEYRDTLQMKRPPLWFQNAFFGLLAPLGRWLGYKARYPHHQMPEGERVEVEPWPEGYEIPKHSTRGGEHDRP